MTFVKADLLGMQAQEIRELQAQLAASSARETALRALVEQLESFAADADREGAAYAEVFAPSRRLEGRAEAFRQSAKLLAVLLAAPPAETLNP